MFLPYLTIALKVITNNLKNANELVTIMYLVSFFFDQIFYFLLSNVAVIDENAMTLPFKWVPNINFYLFNLT